MLRVNTMKFPLSFMCFYRALVDALPPLWRLQHELCTNMRLSSVERRGTTVAAKRGTFVGANQSEELPCVDDGMTPFRKEHRSAIKQVFERYGSLAWGLALLLDGCPCNILQFHIPSCCAQKGSSHTLGHTAISQTQACQHPFSI